ncbi:MAG: AsmA family protein [Pseudomonadota bacterium]
MFRFLFRLVAFVIILVIVLVGGLFLISGERLAKIAGDQLTTALGRDVSITEDLSPQLFPTLGVRTGAFEVAGTTGDAPLISGEALSVGVDFAALFSRRIEVQEVTLVSPTVTLLKDAEGNTNWADGTQAVSDDGTDAAGAAPEISLAGLSIQNGTVRYRDDITGTDVAFENVEVSAALPEAGGALTAALSFLSNGQTARGEVELASLSQLLAGELTDAEITAEIGPNTIAFDGVLSSAGLVEGTFSAALPDPNALSALAGGSAAGVPAEVLPIEASGALNVAPDSVEITNGAYRFGQNRLQGPVSVALADVPFITAQLSGGALDLSFLSAEEGSAAPEPATGQGWSTDPIDASALALLNADIRLDATALDLGTTAMQNVSAAVTIDNSRAVARILEAQAFGGALTGQFVVNNRSGLSVGGEMEGKTVAIQALLTDMAGFERMRGAGNTQISFLGSGQSLDAIMRSLSGNGSLDIGRGDITGFDLASLFGGGDGAEAIGDRATTIFQSLSATFTIANGVMRNNDLLISANLFEARGAGDVDLGQQSLDYTIQPEVFDNDLTGGLSIPVRIEGPWSGPRIYPDLEAVARQRLAIEEEKLRAEAEAKLEAERQRVERRLEEEKDDLEDKLKDELRRGLGRLFD